ncbi:hypothetical protein ACOI9V_04590 [Corynebacterium striatum]|uniref:hypothetical protein n=1 Tax=Corynebacterium striatum TaxID=43770 RepID=UPI003B59F4B2
MAQRPQGTFVSLSESDKEQLRRLIAGGLSLRAAVQEVGWVKSADVVYEFFRIVGDRLAGIGSGTGLGVVGH